MAKQLDELTELKKRYSDLKAENLWLRLSSDEKKLIRQMIDKLNVSGLTYEQDTFARWQLLERCLIVGIANGYPSFTKDGEWLKEWIERTHPYD